MIRWEEIRGKLEREYREGATQAKLSRKYGINQQNICKILSGQNKGERVHLKMLNRMFPNCSLGTGNGIALGENSSVDIASPHSAPAINSQCEARKIQRIVEETIKSDISPDAKDKFLKIVLAVANDHAI